MKHPFKLIVFLLDACATAIISAKSEMSQAAAIIDNTIDAGAAKSAAAPMAASGSKNMFLEGNFAPIQQEYTLEHRNDFEIRGKIPKDLSGALYRNGPNPQHPPGNNYHWFLGDGMLHAFYLNRGEVSYRNRYVRTPSFEIEKRTRKNLFLAGGFHPLAQLELIGGNLISLMSGLVRQGNADHYTKLIAKSNTALMHFRDDLYALVESSPPMKINGGSLDTLGFETFASKFVAPFTAHPKIDTATGYLYSFGYRLVGKPKLEYFVVNPSGKMVARTAIDIPYYAMIHDFIITRNFAVLPVFPAVASLKSLAKGRIAEWQPEKGAYVYVLSKDGDSKSIRKFELDPCYVYHYSNAYEDGKKIIFDAVRYETLPLMGSDEESRTEIFQHKNGGLLTRFELDTESGKISVTPLSTDFHIEFPVIDNRLCGERYEQTFAAATRGTTEGGFFDSQVMYNISKNGKVRHEIHELPTGHFGGEPIFIPTGKPGEKKGYVLNMIYDSHAQRSYLSICDAEKLDRKPIAEVGLPHRIPYGFHGIWINRKK